MRCWGRWQVWAGIGASFLGILLAALALNLDPVAGYLGTHVSEYVSTRLGRKVLCRALRVRLDRIDLEQVSFARGESTILAIDVIRLYPRWRDLLSGRLELERIEGDGFSIVLSTGNAPGTVANEGGPEDGSEAGFRSVLKELSERAPSLVVALRRGQVLLSDTESLEAVPVVALPSIRVVIPDSLSASLNAALEVGSLDSDESLSVGLELKPDLDSWVVRIGKGHFDFDNLRPYLERLQPIPGVGVSLTLPPPIAGWPVMEGDCELQFDRKAHRVELNGMVRFSGIFVDDERIAAVPIGPFVLEQEVNISVDIASRALTIERWRGSVNGVGYELEGRLSEAGGGWDISGTIELKRVAYQDCIDALPRKMIPALEGIRLGGSLDLTIRVDGNTQELESVSTEVSGDWSHLWLEAPCRLLAGPEPLKGETYIPETTTGVSRRLVLGREAPGWVPLEALPPYLLHGLLVSEDINFFNHDGFDPEALRAALQDNLKAGRTVRGGSTITQQLAKNLFLTRERTLSRKLQEVVLAWQLERVLKKKRILEYYLNIIEWGPGIFGVERAAFHYFDKPASALSIREAAYLCTIIPGPIRYYVYYKRGRLSERWEQNVNDLLGKMRFFEYLSEEEYQRALVEALRFRDPVEADVPGEYERDNDAGNVIQ